ncbi:MAG: GIY-YIG nuclease family protein [Leptolyngbyaceae cyanobacterium CSU_1_3]|nr:GIY-YIG nuclease family protein [Leptolyngbyaceae cyanobacterium CSU_1_3]
METEHPIALEHQNVPQAHQGLHSFLYGSDDEHSATRAANLQSQGDEIMTIADWSLQAANSKIAGVYAVFDDDRTLQYVGYSRNVLLSLNGHITQVGEKNCTFLRLKTFKFPKREEMEQLRDAWIAESGSLPLGNQADGWAATVGESAKLAMTAADREAYEEKKLKLRKAMADQDLSKETNLTETEADRRQKLESAVHNDDWSGVIQQSQSGEVS